MLEKLVIENFLSFRDETIISCVPEQLTGLPKNISETNQRKIKLLRGLGLFGYNASGKSNLVKAFLLIKNLILEQNQSSFVKTSPFYLDYNTMNKSSKFELTLWISNRRYRYGFVIDDKIIYEEWFFIKESQKEKLLFVRSESETRTNRKIKSEITRLSREIGSDRLILTELISRQSKLSLEISAWLNSLTIIQNYNPRELIKHTIGLLEDPVYSKIINQAIGKLSLGLSSLKLKYLENRKKLVSFHYLFRQGKAIDEIEFDFLNDESLGTIKIVALIGQVVQVVNNGGLLVIDEYDSSLDSRLAHHFLKLFNNTNPEKIDAQLIFVSHDHQIWDNKILRRDQNLLIEKDKFGVSTLKKISRHNLRKDKSIVKSYLDGKLGDVPSLNHIQLKLDL